MEWGGDGRLQVSEGCHAPWGGSGGQRTVCRCKEELLKQAALGHGEFSALVNDQAGAKRPSAFGIL